MTVWNSSWIGMTYYFGDYIQKPSILVWTPDVSHTEQITVIVGHVYLHYTNKKVEFCNGWNMWKTQQISEIVLDINKLAFYVVFSAHFLILVVNAVENISHWTNQFLWDSSRNLHFHFVIFQIIFKHLPELKLKVLSVTWRSSTIDIISLYIT